MDTAAMPAHQQQQQQQKRPTRPALLATSNWNFPPPQDGSGQDGLAPAEATADSQQQRQQQRKLQQRRVVAPNPRAVSPLSRTAAFSRPAPASARTDGGEPVVGEDGNEGLDNDSDASSCAVSDSSSPPHSPVLSSSDASAPVTMIRTTSTSLNMDPQDLVETIRLMIRAEINQQAKSPRDSQANLSLADVEIIPASYPSPAPSVAASCSSKMSKDSTPSQLDSPSLTNATVSSISLPPRTQETAPQANSTQPRSNNVRFRDRPKTVVHNSRSSNDSPTPPATTAPPIGVEFTSVDLKWGNLIEPGTGRPTQRLGQVLRGIANYLTASFAGRSTLVITPAKLAIFYKKFQVGKDAFSFVRVFHGTSKEAMDNLAELYLELGCEFHLVQGDSKSRPNLPSLTPLGFEKWMRINIFAYPDQEAERMGAVMAELPIDADGPPIDGKPERLPKQLSRYLLPAIPDDKERKRLVGAIRMFFEASGATSRSTSPPTQRTSTLTNPTTGRRGRSPSPPPPQPQTSERRRRPTDVDEKTLTSVLPDRYAAPTMQRRSSMRRRPSSTRTYDKGDTRIETNRPPRPSLDRTASARAPTLNIPPPPVPLNRSSTTAADGPPSHSGSSSYPTAAHAPPPRSWTATSPPATGQTTRKSSAGSTTAYSPTPHYGQPFSPTSSGQPTPSSSFSSSTGGHFEIASGREPQPYYRRGTSVGNGGSQDDYNNRYSPRASRGDIDSTPRPMASTAANRRSMALPTDPDLTWDDIYRNAPASGRGGSFDGPGSYR